MKYETFLTNVKDCIRKKQGEEVRIEIGPYVRNNGRCGDSISVIRQGENLSIAIDLAPLYALEERGMPVSRIADRILERSFGGRKAGVCDMSFFTDYRRAEKRIVCRLIHYEKNRGLLSEIPHVRFLDLAIVHYYLVEEEILKDASVLIRNDHLEFWGVSPGELHRRAMENTPRLLPCEINSMFTLLQSMGVPVVSEERNQVVHVLTNREKLFGAVYMAYPQALDEAARKLKSDFYVLPGSVHECILVPVSEEMSPERLQGIVKEVNEALVEPEEILSDSVYQYDRAVGKLQIAADGLAASGEF